MAELSLEHQTILKKYSEEIRAKNIVHLREMKKHLVSVFGEEFHQIKENSAFRDNDNNIPVNNYMDELKKRLDQIHYTFTVHFPVITLKNKDEKTHTITDLYVRFFLRGDLRMTTTSLPDGDIAALAGLRTSFTPQEWTYGYAHSHLPGKAQTFERFCTGAGPINQIIRSLSRNYNGMQFYGFLQIVKGFVAYESLEGGPHKYMSSVGLSPIVLMPVLSLSDVNFKQFFDLNYRFFLQEYKLLNFTVSDTKVDVVVTDEFDIKLAEFIRTNFQSYRTLLGNYVVDQLTPIKMSDGRYATSNTSGRQAIPHYSPVNLIEFKKQQKQLYIGYGNNTDGTGTSVQRYTHPAITERFCRYFSELLTTAAIKLQNPGW